MSRLERVRSILESTFSPLELVVTNFSHQHNVPEGSESHIQIEMVAQVFNGKRLVQRHRLIYAALESELADGLHALQLELRSPEEAGVGLTPPLCRGGSKNSGD